MVGLTITFENLLYQKHCRLHNILNRKRVEKGKLMPKKSSIGGRNRLGVYTISEVFDYIDASPKNGQRVKFHGHSMNMRSTRMLSFRSNGITCVKCGARGAFFAKERYGKDAPHLNLYGFDVHGRQLLLTRDHIKPKSKGGTNHIYNSQTMCLKCNSRKSDDWGWKIKLKYYWKKFKFWLNGSDRSK